MIQATVKIKRYDVTETTGVVQTVDCSWLFNDNGNLTFRQGERGDSEVVAYFAAGNWISCVKRPIREPADG